MNQSRKYYSDAEITDRRIAGSPVTTLWGGERSMEAYCVKCKSKQQMKNPTAVVMKNGKPATTGTCSVCGTKMYKIGK